MKSLAIHGALDLRLEDVPVPEPTADQVRLKVAYVGICGSDLHYYFQGANGDFVVEEPLVPGHELSGVVDLDPSGTYAPGTPVTVHPATFGEPLPECPDARHLWPGGSYLGSASTHPHTQGAMSEYLLVGRDMVRPLPEGLDLRTAALAEPLGVALHAANMAGELAGAKVLVIGSGPIGLLQIAAALGRGAASVDASDVIPEALERAKDLGAARVFRAGADEIPDAAYDVVFECSGSAPGSNSAWRAVRRRGVVVHVGMLPAGPQPLALSVLVNKEATVRTTFRFDDEIDEAVTMLRAHPEFARVITHEYAAADAVSAFEIAKDSSASGKVLVRMD